MYSILCKTYDSKRYAFKSKWKSLGSLHTKDLAQPKMQMNSESFFQGKSMICSGLFQGLKEDQEKKLWGIFLIRLFQLRKSPDLNITNETFAPSCDKQLRQIQASLLPKHHYLKLKCAIGRFQKIRKAL